MQRKLILIIIALFINATNIYAFNLALKTDIFNDLQDIRSIGLAIPLRPVETLTVSYKSWNFSTSQHESESWGIGFSYRFYSEAVYSGNFYGLGIDTAVVNVEENSDPGTTYESASTFYFPYYELGHAFKFQDFSIEIGLSAVYIIGQVRNIDFPYLGLQFIPQFSFSYFF